MAREIRGWNIGEVVTANEMTLNSANIYEETGSNGEANLPCIYNGLTLQSQSGSGNSIVTFNPGVARCQDLPTSTYTYLPTNAYGTGYPCYIDISLADSNTVITLTTSPSPGYIVATFSINPTTSGAVNYLITGSLSQIAIGSYNPAIHVRLCRYTYTGSTFVLDFTPNTNRDTDFTGIGGINWNYQNSSLEINTPASQSGTSVVVKQPLTATSTTTLQNTTIIQGANALRFYNSGNTHYTSLQSGASSSDVGFILPIADATSANQFITSNMSGQLSFASPPNNTWNIAANDSNVIFTSLSNPNQICNVTAARTYTMPAVLTAGVPWTFYNQATTDGNLITINASGGSTIDYVLPVGYLQLIPLTSNPTLASNWKVVEAHSQRIPYTPIFGSGWGTVTGISMWYWRKGDNQYVQGVFQLGNVSAATSSISLGGGFNLDLTKINTTTFRQALGTYTRLLVGSVGVYTSGAAGVLQYDGVNADFVRISANTNTQTSNSGDLVNSVFFNNDSVTIDYLCVPISGWAG